MFGRMKTNEKQMKIWEIWKYALGSFSDDKTAPYDDLITIVRTLVLITYLITNCFIIYGVTRTHIFPVHQQPVKC